jgi:plasmid stability protein
MKSKSIQVSNVPDDLRKAAKVKAAREGRPLTVIIREFLERWVKEDKPTPSK